MNKTCFCGISEHCGYQIETDMEQHDKVIYEQGYNKAIDDLLKQVRFEEKWLFDTGLRSQDVNIAFSGIYSEAKKLKSKTKL